MRIAVIGSSGSGKTTMARRLGEALRLEVIELDAINWQAGWRDLNTHAPDEFRGMVASAIAPERWVTDGNYTSVLPMILNRATHLVWLDYSKTVVMSRVFWRSFSRSVTRQELWPGTGNIESWRNWLDKEHPIRWAWSTFESRRTRYEKMLAGQELAHLTVCRLRRTKDASELLRTLGSTLR